MAFNSIDYFIFLTLALVIYHIFHRSYKTQNLILLCLSYYFYAYWDVRFLSLLVISTIVDFVCSLKLHQSQHKKTKKLILTMSIIVNLGILGIFKYYGFFIESFISLLSLTGLTTNFTILKIILPMGISFYTFQSMSYTIDVYRGKLKPTTSIIDFAAYVSFFPQLVAGPIERATNLLPQFNHKRKINYDQITQGSYLIFWGLFKKVFIADNMAQLVDLVYATPYDYSGLAIIIATIAFAFQIYADFSGYTDMARGSAKLFGFELMLNFNLPYFSKNPSEFWKRWHISLSSWFKDYLYIPLGGNKKGLSRTYVNLIITMLLAGLWHGAAWPFVLWGLYHGLLLVFHRFFIKKPNPQPRQIITSLSIFIMFIFTCYGWLIFRAQSLSEVMLLTQNIFVNITTGKLFSINTVLVYVFIASPLIFIQSLQWQSKNLMIIFKWHFLFRTAWFLILFYLMVLLGNFHQTEFIYFQF